jgi:hypothetical protein
MNPGTLTALLSIVVILFPACQQGRDAADPGKTSYVSIANDRYGRNVEFIPNADSSFILCINREETPGQPIMSLRFFVFDVARDEILYEDSLDQAEAYWINPSEVRVVSTPEVTSGDESPGGGYIYDVRERKRRK